MNNENTVICDRCKAGPMLQSKLLVHIENNMCRGKYNPCTRCIACFLTKEELENHKGDATLKHNDCPETSYYCRNCCMGPYYDIHDFQDHFRNRPLCKKSYTVCPHCSDIEMDINGLQKHFIICPNMVNCEICNERFGVDNNYLAHHIECSKAEIARLKKKVKSLKEELEELKDNCGEYDYINR